MTEIARISFMTQPFLYKQYNNAIAAMYRLAYTGFRPSGWSRKKRHKVYATIILQLRVARLWAM